ncbi:hypothetical protein CIB48_g9612 [Xylaria polymorpha]|nr:hypothetical protein CIB48_g9612 [Xylaria polymorpha]
MSDLDTFTFLPIQIDPATKSISTTSSSRTLQTELAALKHLSTRTLTLPPKHPYRSPRPPVPVNPKRSAQITKLRDSGNAEHRKGRHAEAVKLYSLGLQMALGRPLWEPQGLVREEVAGLYSNRAQAHMAVLDWPEAAADAEASVEAKRVGNAKAWWRRGKALMEMGRLEEAADWVKKGLELEGQESELVALLAEVEKKIKNKTPLS